MNISMETIQCVVVCVFVCVCVCACVCVCVCVQCRAWIKELRYNVGIVTAFTKMV